MDEKIENLLDSHNLRIEADFVPYSRSQSYKENAKLREKSLNWRVTLMYKDKPVLTTEYSAGIAHCPSYKHKWHGHVSMYDAQLVEYEIEHGRQRFKRHGEVVWILPDRKDVIYALLMDSETINYPTFEEWADSIGYDTDSRSAEKIYRACLETGLKMRTALGDKVLAELNEAFANY